MKNLGNVNNAKSVTTKEYVDNRVVANPQSSGTPTELEKLSVGGSLFAPRTVIANPTLAGTESALNSIQIGNIKYSMGSQSNIATVETGTSATKAYVVGEYVVVGGQLYRVTAAIASGGTFTPGTNVSATSVGNRLQSIETSVNELGIYRFTKTVSYYSESNSLTLNVPKNSLHLIIVGTPGGTKYRYLGIVSGYTTTSYDEYGYPTTYNYVSVTELFKGTDITVTGTSGSTSKRTLTFAFTSDRTTAYTAVVEVLTLSGGRMT